LNFKTEDDLFATDVSFEEIANAVEGADTANWQSLILNYVTVFGMDSKILLKTEKNKAEEMF
jgi:hypothetical protein